MDRDTLLPCPFCGEPAHVNWQRMGSAVVCGNCDARSHRASKAQGGAKHAAKRWNRRALSQQAGADKNTAAGSGGQSVSRSDFQESPAAERCQSTVPQWVPCTPDLLAKYPSDACSRLPRRPGRGGYSHDHYVMVPQDAATQSITEATVLKVLSSKFKDAWTDRDRQAFIDMLRAAGVEVKP